MPKPETIAVFAEFETRVSRFVGKEDLGALDALAQNGIFASRDPDWINEFPDLKAINVQTYVEKFDKQASGFRRHYDLLSERCHPNALGHNFMFAKLDRSDGSVRFTDEQEPQANGQLFLVALVVLPLIETMTANLDHLILKVSELHHRVSLVGGHPSSSTAT
jgi:hypothetical protein